MCARGRRECKIRFKAADPGLAALALLPPSAALVPLSAPPPIVAHCSARTHKRPGVAGGGGRFGSDKEERGSFCATSAAAMDSLSASPPHSRRWGCPRSGPRARTRGRRAVRRARLHDLPGQSLCTAAPRCSGSGAAACREALGQQCKRGVECQPAGVAAWTGCCGAAVGAQMESRDV